MKLGRVPGSPADFWRFRTPNLGKEEKQHAANFVRLAGFDPAGLTNGELGLILHSLARTEELETERRHNGHNWTVEFGGLRRRRLRHEPYLDQLLQSRHREGSIERLEPPESRWPEGKRFALVLTHDVDQLVRNSVRDRIRLQRHLLSAPAERRPFLVGGLLRSLAGRIADPTNRNSCWQPLDAWMETEARHGFTSSFFFFGQPLPHPVYEDAFYRYGDTARFEGRRMEIGDIIRAVAASGWDVGLHGSRRAHLEVDVLRREKEQLEAASGREVRTARQHHLTFDVTTTPILYDAVGLAADSSLGSNQTSDFRCGTGLPFFYFDRRSRQSLNLLSVPLIVQDVALFRVQQMDAELAVRHVTELMQDTAARRAALTLLWHNSVTADSPEAWAYRRILEEASGLGAWGCSVAEIDRWWRQRAQRILVSG